MASIRTGNTFLDDALAGGLPKGGLTLIWTAAGAGGPEFTMATLRQATRAGTASRARFVTATRAAARAQREATTLFESEKEALAIEWISVAPAALASVSKAILPNDVILIESLAMLVGDVAPSEAAARIRELADAAAKADASVILLAATGSVGPVIAAMAEECADAVLSFAWLSGGPTRRRILTIATLRGLSPMLDQDLVPVYEVGLHTGVGFTVSSIKSVA